MVTSMGWALTVSARVALSSPVTWNVGTGRNVKVPGPLAEKSYRPDTANKFNSIDVASTVLGFDPYRRAQRSHSGRRR